MIVKTQKNGDIFSYTAVFSIILLFNFSVMQSNSTSKRKTYAVPP